MSVNLEKVRTFLTTRSLSFNVAAPSAESPEIGFKVFYIKEELQLKVRVIGGRQFPSSYGNIKPEGYLIKVRVYPAPEKYETTIVKEPWPTYNQEFTFSFQNATSLMDPLSGRFIIFTAYAILQTGENSVKIKKRLSLRRFFSLDEGSREMRREDTLRRSKRTSFNNRRTIGAVTYNLEMKNFTQKHGGRSISTADIWREIKMISSGIERETKDDKKGNLEVTLQFSNSEDGNNDLFELSLTRLRCSMKTMQEHEKISGSLYIKMTVLNMDVLISKWKSDRFEPTISMKIESNTATVRAFIRNEDLDYVKFVIRLMAKNALRKKTVLGRIEIDNSSDIFQQAITNPCSQITQLLPF